MNSKQEFKAILTKMTLVLLSVIGIIAALLGLLQIKASFHTFTHDDTELNLFLSFLEN